MMDEGWRETREQERIVRKRERGKDRGIEEGETDGRERGKG